MADVGMTRDENRLAIYPAVTNEADQHAYVERPEPLPSRLELLQCVDKPVEVILGVVEVKPDAGRTSAH